MKVKLDHGTIYANSHYPSSTLIDDWRSGLETILYHGFRPGYYGSSHFDADGFFRLQAVQTWISEQPTMAALVGIEVITPGMYDGEFFLTNMYQYVQIEWWKLAWHSAGLLTPRMQWIEARYYPGFCPYKGALTMAEQSIINHKMGEVLNRTATQPLVRRNKNGGYYMFTSTGSTLGVDFVAQTVVSKYPAGTLDLLIYLSYGIGFFLTVVSIVLLVVFKEQAIEFAESQLKMRERFARLEDLVNQMGAQAEEGSAASLQRAKKNAINTKKKKRKNADFDPSQFFEDRADAPHPFEAPEIIVDIAHRLSVDGLRDFIHTQMVVRPEHLHYEVELARFHAESGKSSGNKSVPSGFKAVLFLWNKMAGVLSGIFTLSKGTEADENAQEKKGGEGALEEPRTPVPLPIEYAEFKKR